MVHFPARHVWLPEGSSFGAIYDHSHYSRMPSKKFTPHFLNECIDNFINPRSSNSTQYNISIWVFPHWGICNETQATFWMCQYNKKKTSWSSMTSMIWSTPRKPPIFQWCLHHMSYVCLQSFPKSHPSYWMSLLIQYPAAACDFTNHPELWWHSI